MRIHGTPPTAAEIWSTLIELYAQQCGVKIEYEIVDNEKREVEKHALHG